ncbi:MAG: ABC transporter permease [Acidobacteriota bacterium]
MALLQDARYTIRTMRKSPGFTAAAVLALALGIGANTAIFTVVNAVLLRPLPYKQPDRLVALTRVYPGGNPPTVSVPKFFAWKKGSAGALEKVAAYDFMGPGVSLSGDGQPEQIKSIHASIDYFALFGVSPAAGRFFTEEEDRPGGARVAVISNGLWKRRFGGDPGLVGRTIALSGEPYTVVGVAAAGFEPIPPADIWVPLQADPASINQGHYLLCGGRLKPGVTIAAANARMKSAAEQFRRQFPGSISKEESAGVIPMQDLMVGDIRPVLLIMLGAVAFVLLISCANVANLLLARAAGREKEIAIRVAIGAGRGRLVRQLLTESALLALAGGALGLLAGYWGLKGLLAFTPSEIPRLADMGSGLDLRVFGFTLAVSLLTGILFGLAPAFQISRPDVNSTLRESSGRSSAGVRHMRARSVLVVSEIALGLVLLIGAGLLIRSAAAIRNERPGFDPGHALTFKAALNGAKYEKTAGAAQFTRLLTERLESIPGVQAAATIVNLPAELGPDMPFQIEGRPASAANATGDEYWRYVSPHFLKALGVPLLRGRTFTENDVANAPAVVIINEAMAKKYWPKEDPIGQRITIGKGLGPEFEDPTREIVGVVGSVRERGLENGLPPVVYVPQAQVRDAFIALGSKILPSAWVVRTSMDPLTMVNAVRREVVAVDPQQAVFDFRSLDQVLEKSMATRGFILLLLTVFAGAALVLAAIGIYGVMAYDVEQRTQEIGIRVALGADGGSVARLVVRRGMLLAGIGVAIGLAAAFGVTRVLKAMLYGVNATDPLTFTGVAVALAAVALAACYIPARRATRVDPIIALR